MVSLNCTLCGDGVCGFPINASLSTAYIPKVPFFVSQYGDVNAAEFDIL